MRYEHSLHIARPPAEVWAYLSDPRHLPEWQQSVEEVRLEGEPGLGTRFRETRVFAGRRIVSTLEISAYEPGERFAVRVVEGPVRLTVDHVLREADGGTELTLAADGEPGRLFRFAAGVVARAAKRQAVGDFERLRRLLEAT